MTAKSPGARRPASRSAGRAAGNLQSLDRAIALLRAAADSEAGLRLTELATAVGLSKSTTHRIVSALVEHRLLRQATDTRLYAPGSELYRLSVSTRRHFSLVDLVSPSLERLAATTGDTVLFSIVDGRDALCLALRTGGFPIRTLTLAVGERRPLGVGAASLALLAALPTDESGAIVEEEAARLPRYPAYTADALARWVRQTRRNGYALNRERVVPGMSAVGLAVPGREGRPLGALSVAAITSRLGGARLQQVVAQLRAEGGAIAAEMGRR